MNINQAAFKTVNLSELVCNERNPRHMRTAKFSSLVDSVLTFPKMMVIRPIVVDAENVVIGGNMRLHALEEIKRLVISGELDARIRSVRKFRAMSDEDKRNFLDSWDNWVTQDCPVTVADAALLTPEEREEFVIKDNVSAGEWDWNELGNWDSLKLNEWGLDVWGAEPDMTGGDQTDANGTETAQETPKEHKLRISVTLDNNADYDAVFEVVQLAVAGFNCKVK